MDHNEAIQLQAAVKYVLGELSPVQRDDYEEHYFDCAECAVDIKALATFADTTRQVLRQERASQLAKDLAPARGGWLRWLQPVVAVPAMAVLLLMLGYQSFVTVPHWKNLATGATAPRVLLPTSLIAANSRGNEPPTVRVRPDEAFGFYVDVPTDPAYTTYELKLEDPEGNSKTMRTISYAEAQKTVVVEVKPGTLAGTYHIVVLGLPSQETASAKKTVLASLKFIVELVI